LLPALDGARVGAYSVAALTRAASVGLPWPGRSPTEPSTHRKSGRTTMKLRPLYDRILVKRVEAEEKTSSGLIIPEAAKEKPLEAEVIAVGSGRVTKEGKVRPMSLSVGDRVLFGKYTGDEIKLDGVEHIILREEDVLAVIER
jgi:chaperonin GroES